MLYCFRAEYDTSLGLCEHSFSFNVKDPDNVEEFQDACLDVLSDAMNQALAIIEDEHLHSAIDIEVFDEGGFEMVASGIAYSSGNGQWDWYNLDYIEPVED